MDVSRDTVDRNKCYGFQKYSEISWGHENLSKSELRSRKLINSITLITRIFNNPGFYGIYTRKTYKITSKMNVSEPIRVAIFSTKIIFTKIFWISLPTMDFVTTKQSYSKILQNQNTNYLIVWIYALDTIFERFRVTTIHQNDRNFDKNSIQYLILPLKNFGLRPEIN